MITLKNEFFVKFADEKKEIIAEIFVDNKNELPAPSEINGKILYQGSVAYIIKSGELYVMGGDGLWYSTKGEAIS